MPAKTFWEVDIGDVTKNISQNIDCFLYPFVGGIDCKFAKCDIALDARDGLQI